LQGLHAFFVAQGLHGLHVLFAAAQGLQAFFAAQGLQAVLAEHAFGAQPA